MRRVLVLAAAAAVAAPTAGGAGSSTRTPVLSAAPGHRIAAISLDRSWLTIAEDPVRKGVCPLVVLVRLPAGTQQRELTRPGGESCRFGGHFWVRPGMRPLGNAIVKALWVLRNGTRAEAVKASPSEREVPLVRVTEITARRGPFLGPVVATNWLRLFGDYSQLPDGTLIGGAISGNNRELWADTGPVLPLGLDDAEHAVAVGADGSIAMWQAHGARYGRVADAHARAAALDAGTVYVLRDDRAQLDVRTLAGTLVRSWPLAARPAPYLDVAGGTALYVAGGAVHELNVGDGADRTIARAPKGATIVDAQIEPHFVAYAVRGGPAGRGRVVVLAR